MRAVVTGAAGFAGTHLIEHLLREGDVVLAVVKSDLEATQVKATWEDQVSCRLWDISKPATEELRLQLKQFEADCIYHLAAISFPSQCGELEPTPQCRAVNVDGAVHVANWAASGGARRLLFVSSAHVYGGSRAEPWYADETDIPNPQTGYGKSKLQAEKRLKALDHDHPLRLITVRQFNHTGPGQTGPLLVPEWTAQFSDPQHKSIVVQSLKSTLDLCDARDVAQAYRRLASTPNPPDIVNIGSGKSVTTGQLFDLFCEVTGKSPQVRAISDVPRNGPVANCDLMQQITGWRCTISLKQTLADTVDFFARQS